MTDPFLVGTVVASVLLFAAILVVANLLTGATLPRRRDYADALALLEDWLRDELEDDVVAIQMTTPVEAVRKAVETVLILGLGIRTGTHVLCYLIATAGREPDSVRVGFVDAVGPRPTWHRVLSVIVTACIVGFVAQNYSFAGLAAYHDPLTYHVIVGYMALNGAAAVHDVVLLPARTRPSLRSLIMNTNTDTNRPDAQYTTDATEDR